MIIRSLHKSRAVWLLLALWFLYGAIIPAFLAADINAPIDWNRARELLSKSQQGEALSPEDQAYLDRAKAERAKAVGNFPANANPAEIARARQLIAKQNGGQDLTDDERAFIRQMREKYGKAGKNGPPGAPPPAPRDTTGLVPLDQMTAQDRYKGQDGGLYGGGKNQPPPEHVKAALAESKQIIPRDTDGKPSAGGEIVLLSVGMSNTTMEYSRFKQLADRDSGKSASLVIVDGAQGGQDAERWNNASANTWKVAEERIRAAGVSTNQVQVIWLKQARIGPSRFGEFPKHNQELEGHILGSLQLAKQRYPNLRIAYLSSRVYAGYATTGLNPEPFAYEGAFAVRDLIQRQIKGDPALNYDPAKGEVKMPLLLWGPYLWADGITPRKSDGLVWKREDLSERDGTHPSPDSGREKVANLLLTFFKNDPTSHPWFAK
jgi:hypothetical protein